MRKFFSLMVALLLLAPATVMAVSIEDLQLQVKELSEQLDEMEDRVNVTERHTATDRISWYGDLRVKADTVHYQDVTATQGVLFDFDDFGARAMAGEFGDGSPGTELAKFMATYPGQAARWMAGGYAPKDYFVIAPPQKGDIDNDILYTTRLRLGMKAKVSDNVNFSGRLNMYKGWGDSTGVKVFDSWSSYTMDGTNSGNTTGDFVRVERAYFDWKNIGDSNFYLSIGRRPSTYGPPLHYRENEKRGGTPSGHLVNFNFDGITVGYKLTEKTGIEGQTIRFCYGQGYESQVGNGELFNSIEVDDVHLGGFNFDALNDGTNFLQLTLFRAQDVTDGFKGVIAVPNSFLPPSFQAAMFPGFNMLTRVQPTTNIGHINLAGIGFSRDEENGINWFTSFGWTQTDPNGKAGLFGGLLTDPIYKAGTVPDPAGGADMIIPVHTGTASTEKQSGYSVYVGVQIPAPMGKVGLEYNYGSQYWTPFTQAADDIVGSKLATRGSVGEAYYIFDVNPRMFIKVGGLYYDYEYSGSGSPVGAPVKISDLQSGAAASMLPVVDTAWDGYASLTVKF